MDKIITLEEVKKHRRKSSVWIVIHNDVYDVTSYLEEHPGGEDALLEVAGEDGTQAFEDVGHSDDAREILKKFKIGSLPVEQKSTFLHTCCKVKRKQSCPNVPHTDKEEKTWRTFDGSPSSDRLDRRCEKSNGPTLHTSPSVERRVQSVVVPRERRRIRRKPPTPPPPSSSLKWAVLALAGAIVIGFVIKKALAK
ncbi:cytochrome b5 reductase 4-like isoform X5 [Pieris brassicae]|uniref:cytochrome b5 reductase 4-like isoform X5 n=1 Tax=Pieris brassicae TaxID=7116 RepID=UPI001E65E353|nr:cytochrome b5 reductase 4-like isoform X5 [Pieris brassicae]